MFALSVPRCVWSVFVLLVRSSVAAGGMSGAVRCEKGFPLISGMSPLGFFCVFVWFCSICPKPHRAVWLRFPSNPHQLSDVLIYLVAEKGRAFGTWDGCDFDGFFCCPITSHHSSGRVL
uniref:Putative secreted peptide n=1 Tax=Anopheles braziliensis TaxID=58242 RepID=A0A2M3ZS20_9DIPT